MCRRQCLIFYLVLLAMQTVTYLDAEQSNPISWFDNYNEALEEAKRTQKPIFLEFRCEP